MRVTVVAPGELGPSEARRWAELQEAVPGASHPFLGLTYVQVMGQHRPTARVAVVEDDGAIVAYLPFELAPRRLGTTVGGPLTALDGIVGGDEETDLRRVVRMAGLRGWRFGHAPAAQVALARHRYVYQFHGHAVLAIDLRDGLEAYLASRTASFRRAVRAQRRRMEKQLGPVELEWASRRPEDLASLLDWKAARVDPARRTYSPAASRAVEALRWTNDDACEALVSVLSAGERVAAVNLHLRRHRALYGWQMAYDPALGRFSPGTVLLTALIEEAARRGVDWFELGFGQDPYKLRLANASYEIASGAVWASRLEASGRAAYRRLLYEPRMRRRPAPTRT